MVIGSKSVSGGTAVMMTGVAGVVVNALMLALATLLMKDFAKSSALSLLVTDCTGGCSMVLNFCHSERGGLYQHASLVGRK